ncbi:fimbrial protein [Aeromonas veronii]|uniref:fimbrial protein n=1 Tax=Aeromonas veronii TaxID=654 RepID=UPI0032EDEF80
MARQSLQDGAPPAGYSPRPLNITIECSNLVTAPTQLEYFFNGVGAPNAEGPFIATSNPGVVVGMTDDAGNPIGLGSSNSVLRPFQNGQSSMDLRFYPAKTPGYSAPIEPGAFSANAIVTVTVTLP